MGKECFNCGVNLPENATFCKECGEKQPTRADKYDSWTYSKAASMPYNGLPSLADGESVLRSYHCCKTSWPLTQGYLTVTNKRLMFHAYGAISRLVYEAYIKNITGVNTFSGRNLIPWLLGLGGILIISSFISIAFDPLLLLIGLPLGALFCFLGSRKNFRLTVYAEGTDGAPIRIGNGPTTKLGNGALFSVSSTPVEDTNRMMTELGAIVADIQRSGDMAIEKWAA